MSYLIEKIITYPEKGSQGIELAEGRLIENLGLQGDFHATGGERQLSLLLSESREQLAAQEEKGLCFLRFRENLRIRTRTNGLPELDILTPGTRIETGEALLEITGETKHCHEECGLYREGKTCPLTGANLFAKVIKSGTIREGDDVKILL